MHKILDVLLAEEKRLKDALVSGMSMKERDAIAGRLNKVREDLEKMKLYGERPVFQTFSELHFIDDIRQRCEQIAADNMKHE